MLPNAQCAANLHDRRKEAEMNSEKVHILYERLSRDDKLTGAMVAEFVDKIIVHEGEWSEGGGLYKGTRTQQVDVYLKYIGKFDAPDLRTAEEIEAERIAFERAERKRKQHREAARRYEARRKTAAQKTA